MKIQHIRNATMAVEVADAVILVDPMLGAVDTMPPFSLFRFRARRNPTAPLPDNAKETLERVTHCLITHRHPDHIDKAGIKFLRERKLPVICSVLDEKPLKKKGLNVVQTVEYWKRAEFLGGCIEGIPGTHGYGFVAKPLGPVMGFYLEFPDQPSIYLCSDTIYTDDVHRTLRQYDPAICVVPAGSAQFDVFKPLLMTMDDIIRFARDVPHNVVMNHLESINHCPTKRDDLRTALVSAELEDKAFVPEDGDWICLD